MAFTLTHLIGFAAGGGKTAAPTPTVIFLTNTGTGLSWTVPDDWNDYIQGSGGYANKVECIGGGGGGDTPGSAGGGGGNTAARGGNGASGRAVVRFLRSDLA